ncbi:MAG: hypothetical protein AAF797_15680 [Planctomycetota bacterium]
MNHDKGEPIRTKDGSRKTVIFLICLLIFIGLNLAIGFWFYRWVAKSVFNFDLTALQFILSMAGLTCIVVITNAFHRKAHHK